MNYFSIQKGIFQSRPNRFIAHVLVNGTVEIAHVKNTGRCKELLLPGATVYLEPSNNPNRKTNWSLVAVEKGDRLINMDSQAPNKVVETALAQSAPPLGFPAFSTFQREYTFGRSRLDFLLSHSGGDTLIEVKGVTLEKNGAAFFPDAPTERGIKHINELIAATTEGYGAVICFVIQMEGVSYFSPNEETHPAFGAALRKAKHAGVHLLAYDCKVTPASLSLHQPVAIVL